MDANILNEVQRSLGRIEGKQDALLINQERLREDYDTALRLGTRQGLFHSLPRSLLIQTLSMQ